MKIETFSQTWKQIEHTTDTDKKDFLEMLTAQGIGERDADFIRGQLAYLDLIQSLGDTDDDKTEQS